VLRLNTYSPQTIVQSRCGTLEYLSPLGVVMALLPYTICPITTNDTTTKTQKIKPPNPYQAQSGRIAAKHLKKKTERGVLDAPIETHLEKEGLLSLVESSSPLIPLLMSDKPKRKRSQYGSVRHPKST